MSPSTGANVPIWGGRWQPPNIGHAWVLRSLLRRYDRVVIAVVNPDPTNPPVSPSVFERFKQELNPFVFFDRVLLWRKIALELDAIHRVFIVPTWHPREVMRLEETFFPPLNQRIWYVPYESEEELLKVRDFEKLGNRVEVIQDIPNEYLAVSSTNIRAKWKSKQHWQAHVPSTITADVSKLLSGKRLTGKWHILPLEGDYPDDEAIRILGRKISNLVIGLYVSVSAEPEWWRWLPQDEERTLTFYERYRLILEIAKGMRITPPVVVPLFVRKGKLEILDAFLPPPNSRQWIVDPRQASSVEMLSALVNKGERFGRHRSTELSDKIRGSVQLIRERELNAIHYYERRNQMGDDKRDRSGIVFHGPTSIHGNVSNVEGHQLIVNSSSLANFVEELVLVAVTGNRIELAKLLSKSPATNKISAREGRAAVRLGLDRAIKAKSLKSSSLKRIIKRISDSMATAAGRTAGSKVGHMVVDALSSLLSKLQSTT